jgi:predicted phage terminase large subunit-like protein
MQKVLYDYDGLEAFYGGAAGPGKTDALLQCYLKYVHVPGYAGLILRRTYADLALPGAIMDRAFEWFLPLGIDWVDKHKTFTFPSGATLTFGYLDHERARYRYQGAEVQFIGIDELTQFPKHWAMYMFSRLRKSKKLGDIPMRFRTTSNPGDIGQQWVYDRYINDETRNPKTLVLRGTLEDNPYLDPSYDESLQELDPFTYQQLRYGDWSALEPGDMFDRSWFKLVDEPPPAHKIVKAVRFWDIAGSAAKPGTNPDWTAGVKMAEVHDMLGNRVYYVLDVVHFRAEPDETERRMQATAEQDGPTVAIREEQEPGSSGKVVINAHKKGIFAGYSYDGIPSTGDKITRAKPYSAKVNKGHVLLVRGPWNDAYLNELHVFPKPGYKDDQVDGSSGAFNHLNDKLIKVPDYTPGRRMQTADVMPRRKGMWR